jgi:hypothetical protein
MELPKILFLADEIPQSKNAGSIQFLRIFEDYPSDRMLVVGRKPSQDATILNCKYVELTYKVADRIRLSRFNQYLADGEALGLMRYHLPAGVEKQIDEFNPDVVVTLMQLFMYYQSAYLYALKKNKPLIVFCHDDVEEFSRVHSLLKGSLVKRNASIYRFASRRICISPEMEKAWQVKYKISGEVMYPVADKNITPRPIEYSGSLRNEGKLTLGFAGSMAYGYAEGIFGIVPALEASKTHLKIFNHPTATLPSNVSPYIEFCGYAPTPIETWNRIKEECDAVILPYSFDSTYQKLYETHFPSKLPEYLALGMPVIILGPPYSTGVRWASKKMESVIVSVDNTITSNVNQFLSLKNNAQLRLQLARDAQKGSARDFNGFVIKKKFTESIRANFNLTTNSK